jgi:hypothetical protein
MRNLYRRCVITSLVCAVVLLTQIVPAAAQGGDNGRQPVEISFTKWVPAYPVMVGVTGGDVIGTYAGEILQRQVSLSGRVVRLEAVYEVIAGGHSFTALVRGGVASATEAGILDGVILAGWRTGSPVHVEFRTVTPPSPSQPACSGGPPGLACFVGTIRLPADTGGSKP